MYECPQCFKLCGNAGVLKSHMKTHKKMESRSGSMWKWVVKRAPVKSKPKKAEKTAIELKPIVKTRQLKLRKQPVRDPSVIPNPIQPRPPRRPSRSKQEPIDTSPFAAPPELIHPDLDKRSPQFRISHVQHFRSLKSDFPFLDKKMYHAVNSKGLGVSLRRFQEWFQEYEEDLIKAKKPKVKKQRKQNKKVFQGERARITPQQKLDLIAQFDEAKEADSSLTIKAWCESRKNIHEKTFGRWLRPMERKRIEIDARNP